MLTVCKVERADKKFTDGQWKREGGMCRACTSALNAWLLHTGALHTGALHAGCSTQGSVADRLYTDARSILMALWGHFKGTASSTLEA